jgi:hypothetical protein
MANSSTFHKAAEQSVEPSVDNVGDQPEVVNQSEGESPE